jgi:hypothetical protein
MRTYLLIPAALLLPIFCGNLAPRAAANAASQKPRCTPNEEEQASNDIDHLRSWSAIYRSFKRYAQCDDGEIAEGYSDAVAKLLANDWKDLATVKRLVLSDPPFKQFVLNHIDATDSDDDLQRIARNARFHCPQDDKSLCAVIRAQADSALKESRDSGN